MGHARPLRTGAKRTRRGAQQPATHNAQNAHEEARSLSETQTLSLCEDACQPENCELAECQINKGIWERSYREMNEWMNEGWKTTLAALSTDLLQNNLSQTDLVSQ